MNLAAVIICRNEEKNIERCLRSVRFCNEIVVVDAESKDRTCELAQVYATRLVVRPWAGYVEQKNFANSLTTSSWILSLDADEEVSDELRVEIEKLFETDPPCVAYSIPRKTLHSGRWIRYGGWYPNRLVRLFRKESGSWKGDELHEKWEAQGQVGRLMNPLVHHSFEGIADQVERNNHYSTLGALQLAQRGQRFSVGKLCWKPISKFLETYLVKRGFLDGFPGFFISVSAAYSVFLKWAKLKEMDEQQK